MNHIKGEQKMSDFDSCLKPTGHTKNGELAEFKPDIFRTQTGQNGLFVIPTLKLTEALQLQTCRHIPLLTTLNLHSQNVR